MTPGRISACLCALLFCGTAGFAAAPPTSARGVPAPEWEARFDGKEGWIGGDCVYSVELDRDRILWLFGDSLLGKVKNGRRTDATMVNNTVALQMGRGRYVRFRFISGKGKDGKSAAFVTPADGKGWFWMQSGVRIKDRLYLFMPQIEKAGEPGAFGFAHVGQWLAVVENPDDPPEKWKLKQHKLPFAVFGAKRERSWGAASLVVGEHLYVFGYDEEKGKGLGRRQLLVARIHANKLADFRAWRFRTAGGWSEKADEAAGLAGGLATEFTVSSRPGGNGYVLVYTENGLGDRIVARTASTPEGPWSAPVLLYRCPEMAKDKGVFCYAAKAHPWASREDELLVSYCVNAWKFGRLFDDERVYRPRFVWVPLGRRK
jgi:hypothetical protein